MEATDIKVYFSFFSFIVIASSLFFHFACLSGLLVQARFYQDIEQLKKFHKSYYDLEKILSTAQELKYTTELRSIINAEFLTPSAEFVKYFAKQVYEGMVNQRILDLFTPLVKKAIDGIINDTISERLGLAMVDNDEKEESSKTFSSRA